MCRAFATLIWMREHIEQMQQEARQVWVDIGKRRSIDTSLDAGGR